MFAHKKIKKLFALLLSMVVAFSAQALTVHAHNSDYFSGTYTSSLKIRDMNFRIESSAITSLLTSEVYYSAYAWDNVSSHVGTIGIAIAALGMPSTGFFIVTGEPNNDGTLGETIPRRSDGSIANENENWASVSIVMNTKSDAFSGASNPTAAAKKTFIHEVGHTLKLAHPQKGYSISGHSYNGLPRAVMNQGFPNSTTVASTVVSHDRTNLIAKWGS